MLDYCTPLAYNQDMRNTSCLTSTGARNICHTPSVMDRARTQARRTNMAVIYLRPFGVGVALPTDHSTGSTRVYNSNVDAQEALTAAGWEFEQLGEGGVA